MTMDIRNINSKASLSDGEWIGDIEGLDDVRLKVRSTSFKPFKESIAALARRSGKKLNSGSGLIAFGISTGKALSDHILLDWDGVTEGGKPVKYDRKRAEAILTADDDFGIGDAFRKGVEWAGDQVAERIRERAAEAGGN
jgi:hypothetical protein